MTNFYGPASTLDTSDGMPGAMPVPGSGNQMQGNPNMSNGSPSLSLPGNQNSSGQLAATQIANGNISLNSVPTNVLSAPGTDSLLAQMSRGQVILKDSTYGMSQFIPGNAAQPNPINAATTVPVTTGPASGLTYSGVGSAQNYTGN